MIGKMNSSSGVTPALQQAGSNAMQQNAGHIHLIGIGGTGLSAIARVLLQRGVQVSGSDRTASELGRSIEQAGARVFFYHDPENIGSADLVVRSSAVPDDNPEVIAARERGIPVLKRAEFLNQLLADQDPIAVAGTHGKTTTASMISWLLVELGQEPSFIVGGQIKNLGTNARAGSGRVFVIEADEYDRMFLGIRPMLAVITNVEYDHPDYFRSPAEFQQAFDEFVRQVRPDGIVLACGDHPGSVQLAERARISGLSVRQYGLTEGLDYWISPTRTVPGRQHFHLVRQGTGLVDGSLALPGSHNLQNAAAALAVIDLLRLNLDQAAEALGRFEGAGRRFHLRGEVGSIAVVDDYAHHPTEIRATLAAARQSYPNRKIWAVWQPHTYSRTRVFLGEFGQAFGDADQVIVANVFAARESAPADFNINQVVRAIQHPRVRHIGDFEDTVRFLIDHLEAPAAVLVLSAGDAEQLSMSLLRRLRDRRMPDVESAAE